MSCIFIFISLLLHLHPPLFLCTVSDGIQDGLGFGCIGKIGRKFFAFRYSLMGSPLGQRYIQKRIKGNDETGASRYPDRIRRWINLSAVGDLTAIDPELGHDFAEMTELGLVDAIDDREIYNWFRWNGVLNTHSEYGYLANAETARIVVDWWRSIRSVRDSGV